MRLLTTWRISMFCATCTSMQRPGSELSNHVQNACSMGAFHLSMNMFLLDMFGHEVAEVLSPARFVVLYVAGGIASTLASLTSRRLLRNNVLSLGASGSVMATMFMFACLFPERELFLFGIWKLHAKDAMVLWAMTDCAGLLGSFGKIDFAAHLGGGLFSFGYYHLIRDALSREFHKKRRS